jgi:hypothetical protein
MFLFQKSNKKLSSRQQIKIKEVKDGVLVMPNHQYRTIIETSSVNFELKSDEEQDVLIDGFQNFLNSLSCPLQIIIRVREIDVDRYLEEITKRQDSENEAIYKTQMKNYAEFIQKLISGNKILSRKFYIVIPYESKETSDFKLIKEQLSLNQDIVVKGIEKLGMKARALKSLEILDLFYSFYNPKQAKTQPITEETMRLLLNQPYEFAYI